MGISLDSDINKLHQEAADELNRVIDERESEPSEDVPAKLDETDENSQNTET
ncbi:hypothetical protein C435_16360, partial [Haloarcula marismortui ATCC 33799]